MWRWWVIGGVGVSAVGAWGSWQAARSRTWQAFGELVPRVETAQRPTPDAATIVRADTAPARGLFVGATIGLAMHFVLQGLIAGALQLATQGKGDWFASVRFAGFTQLMYVAPTVLLFVNRKCPKMATGVALVAGAVFFANVVYMILA